MNWRHKFKNIIQKIINDLIFLREKIEQGDYKINNSHQKRKGWQGAGVVISTRSPVVQGMGFYPEPKWVTTIYANEISWLFCELRDIFMKPITKAPKTVRMEFYGRLANRLQSFQKDSDMTGDENLKEMLIIVWEESYKIAREIESGKFSALNISIGGVISDDMKQK